MEATPSSNYLQIYWDDSLYNPSYAAQDWPIVTTTTTTTTTNNRRLLGNNENTRDDGPPLRGSCMHLWFQVSKKGPASFLGIQVDKCIK
jgi:hypothetical protein